MEVRPSLPDLLRCLVLHPNVLPLEGVHSQARAIEQAAHDQHDKRQGQLRDRILHLEAVPVVDEGQPAVLHAPREVHHEVSRVWVPVEEARPGQCLLYPDSEGATIHAGSLADLLRVLGGFRNPSGQCGATERLHDQDHRLLCRQRLVDLHRAQPWLTVVVELEAPPHEVRLLLPIQLVAHGSLHLQHCLGRVAASRGDAVQNPVLFRQLLVEKGPHHLQPDQLRARCDHRAPQQMALPDAGGSRGLHRRKVVPGWT
mmetsp:Transcript_25965/g.69008  ORF Transcript_25965/g.69008 Transcript_25965/m.69008 type:complete len:257 (+) Transcript_25965:627-1397(+)